VKWNAPAEMVATINSHIAHISDEVLALSMTEDSTIATIESELGVNVELSKAQ
jgi:isoleucyl-tRNA synthetase